MNTDHTNSSIIIPALLSNELHTFVASDFHLTEAEKPHPEKPLWKRFKRKKLFIDKTFNEFLDKIHHEVKQTSNDAQIELVLNGDIFDFDSVTKLPESPQFEINWLERLRGLKADEEKSRFKIRTILEDHELLVYGLSQFIKKGHQLIFVIGNHDVELHWPSVQEEIIHFLDLKEDEKNRVRFCEWFYVSNQDTLIEHSNQYDAYCVCSNPIFPLIHHGKNPTVRLPFGNIAARYLMNGMGLLNPHVESSFIKPLKEYIVFFYKYQMTIQPFILWSWFWGAMVTLFYSVGDGLLPALKDPLMTETKIESIAEKANVTPRTVRRLRELHVHPAIFNPMQIVRELWLDRAFLVLVIFFGSIQVISFVKLFYDISLWWILFLLVVILPFFIFYAKNVSSDMQKVQKLILGRVPISAQVTKVSRVVHGHTHIDVHTELEGVEYLNTGTWSPAYYDMECTQPYGRKIFAWIKPKSKGEARIAGLYVWENSEFSVIPRSVLKNE